MDKVAFFVAFEFHQNVLNPVYNLLKDKVECLISYEPEEIEKFDPKVVVMADVWYHLFKNRIRVQLRHGSTSKNNSYAKENSQCDYICLNSEFEKSIYISRKVQPKKDFLLTGYPPIDPLFRFYELFFREQMQIMNSGLTSLGLDKNAFTVLYAPTYNREFNSIDFFGDDLIKDIRAAIPNSNIIIKPHPILLSNEPSPIQKSRFRLNWIENFEKFQKENKNVYFVNKTTDNIIDYMVLADCMISDVSAVIFQYMILEKPILLYDSQDKDKETCKMYDPEGIEHKWRDVGYRFASKDTFAKTLHGVKNNDDTTLPAMRRYKNILYGTCQDGKNSERVAQQILEIVK